MEITIDTHALLWYMDKSLNNKLSSVAFNTIQKAEEAGIIYISVITLVEILHLIEKGRINQDFKFILKSIESNDICRIIPLDITIIKELESIKGIEAHDRIIIATSKITNSSLVSKDEIIRNYYSNVIW